MGKSNTILLMYDKLLAGEALRIKDCCEEYHISVATFRRYIALLRLHLTVSCGRELVYDAELCVYRLQ